MKYAIAKKDFHLSGVKVLSEGQKYRILKDSGNGIIIRNDVGGKQGFNKDSDWIIVVEAAD